MNPISADRDYADILAALAQDTRPEPTDPSFEDIRSGPIFPFSAEEALDTPRQNVDERRAACEKKADMLRKRIETEKHKLRTLGEEYKPGAAPDDALNKCIWGISRLMRAVVKNFNAAIEEHTASQDLTDMEMAKSKLLEVESRLRAVEVALQGGIEYGVPEQVSRADAETVDPSTTVRHFSSTVTAEDVSERINYIQEEWFVRLQAAGKQAEDLPPVGFFRV